MAIPGGLHCYIQSAGYIVKNEKNTKKTGLLATFNTKKYVGCIYAFFECHKTILRIPLFD